MSQECKMQMRMLPMERLVELISMLQKDDGSSYLSLLHAAA